MNGLQAESGKQPAIQVSLMYTHMLGTLYSLSQQPEVQLGRAGQAVCTTLALLPALATIAAAGLQMLLLLLPPDCHPDLPPAVPAAPTPAGPVL